jgi:hypothetical protein
MRKLLALRSLNVAHLGLLLVAGALIAAGVPSCTSEEGENPDCKGQDCNPFAVCAAAPGDPAQCCAAFKDKDDGLYGCCLYGYGVPRAEGGVCGSPIEEGTGEGGAGGGGGGGS